MRALFVLFIMVFSSSNLKALDYCFEKYGSEEDRNGLQYQYMISNGTVSKELSFTGNKKRLGVLIFGEHSTLKDISREFELLLAKDYHSSELLQINPQRLKKQHSFAEKLVFPSVQKNNMQNSFLLFSENGCNIIFKQENWTSETRSNHMKDLVKSAELFSVF